MSATTTITIKVWDGTPIGRPVEVPAILINKDLAVIRELVTDETGRRRWSVTHVGTGFGAVTGARTRRHAMRAARQLIALGADWNFTEINAVKLWPKDVVAEIRTIRIEARAWA